jgi:DNA primase
VLVEGYTDVIALHQVGVRNVVGQQGTALTDGQAAELAKLAPVVVLCLDADRAGQDATLKAAAVLRGLPKNPPEVRVATLPEGRDPADLVAAEGDAVTAVIDGAVPLARWQVDLALARGDLGSSEGRDRVLDYTASIINRLPPGLVRGELTQLVGDRLGLSEAVVTARLSEAGRPIPAPANGTPPARRPVDHTEDAERAFLALCLALPTTGRQRLDSMEIDATLASDLTRRAAVHLRDRFDAPASGIPSEDEALAALVAELIVRAGALEEPEAADLEKATLMLDRARLQRQIAAARAAAEPVGELAAEHQRVLSELSRLTV